MEIEGPSRGKILIVDAEAASRQAVVEILERAGYAVECVAHGLEALEYLRSEPRPDLIVLDLQMSVMDGWEFLRHRKEAAEGTIPVIAVSGITSQVPPLGVAACLTKPVLAREFLDAVARCCH